MERLLLEVLRGHVFWRRNFHPRDPRLIDERDKHTEAFDDMSARLRDELPKILAELKRAAQLKDRMDRLHTVRNVVLHLGSSAPSQVLRIARWLLHEADTAPAHLLAVTTTDGDGTGVVSQLTGLGVPAHNLILGSDLLTSARRLVLKLSVG